MKNHASQEHKGRSKHNINTRREVNFIYLFICLFIYLFLEIIASRPSLHTVDAPAVRAAAKTVLS